MKWLSKENGATKDNLICLISYEISSLFLTSTGGLNQSPTFFLCDRQPRFSKDSSREKFFHHMFFTLLDHQKFIEK